MNKIDLSNRVSIVTGGAQGFGLDIAKKFLSSGAKVFIWDVDENELIKATKEPFFTLEPSLFLILNFILSSINENASLANNNPPTIAF